jgi:predicted dehydrogenase
MDSKLRIGVIGLGIIGEQYVQIFQSHALSEVVAVAARTPDKTSAIAAKYGVLHACAHWTELVRMSDVDAVCVVTPDHMHYEPAKAALETGKHVLIEKPMTTDLQEADSLFELSKATGLKLQVAFNHRWLASYYQGHLAIQAGLIGQPVMAYARKNDRISVSTEFINWAASTTPAWFLNSHDIDLVRWYFGSEPVEARAWGVKRVLTERGIDTYDAIQSQVRFASGAIATFESSWIYPNTFPTLVDSFVEIVGERGHLHFDRKRESVELSTNEAFTYPRGFLVTDIFGTLRGAFPACLTDFVRCVQEDLKPAVDAVDGRQVTAALAAIHESLETGNTVAVSPMNKQVEIAQR